MSFGLDKEKLTSFHLRYVANAVNGPGVFLSQLIIPIVIVQLKDNVVVIQEDGTTSPTVVEEDPFTEVLDITNQAEELDCPKFTMVLWQNVEMLRGVEAAGCLLCVLGSMMLSFSEGLEMTLS